MKQLLLVLAGLALLKPGAAAEVEVMMPKVDLARWQKLDLEGQWVAYKEDAARAPDLHPGWLKFLAQQKNYELLEWIAVYELNGRYEAAAALAGENAPQWIRCMVYAVDHPESHTQASAQSVLETVRPGLGLAWLQKYPQAVSTPVAPVLEKLKVLAPALEDVMAQLPPLEIEKLLAALDAPKELEDFGRRERAEPGKTYIHQVQRAIDGLVVSGERGDPWLGKLIALTTHPEPKIRRAAYLAFTHMPLHIPLSKFWNVVVSPGDDADRGHALLACSYSPHPRMYSELHQLALDPKHPAWKAAISRLGELGNGFTLQHMKALDAKALDDEGRNLLDASLAAIRGRADQEDAGRVAAEAERLFERAAWQDVNCEPLEGTLVKWTLEHVGKWKDAAEMRQALQRIGEGYVPAPPIEGSKLHGTRVIELMQERVRDYAKRLLK